jgi:hypothetical protein
VRPEANRLQNALSAFHTVKCTLKSFEHFITQTPFSRDDLDVALDV